ncbi:MAG: outer membrane protein assembly factor BamA [Planctomycetota bacterium]|nr:MAG: outer membrane protein assembly factor BamA [Planctomycetota bacterium]
MKAFFVCWVLLVFGGCAAAESEPQEPPAAEPQGAIRAADFEFEGNQNIGRGELENAAVDEFVDLEKYGYRRAEVDDAAFMMESYYRDQGYPFARVRYRYRPQGDRLLVRFLVEEGPRTNLEKIRITGNSLFTNQELYGFFLTGNATEPGPNSWFVQSKVDSAASGIRTAYMAQGYLEAQVVSIEPILNKERTQARLRVVIEEGIRHFIQRVRLPALDDLPQKALQEAAEKFHRLPYYPRRNQEVRSALEEVLAEAGHADAKVETNRISRKDGREIMDVQWTPGPKVTIQAIEVLGNEKTSSSFIRSRLRLQPGVVFSRSGERESFARLYQTGLFKTIDMRLKGTGEQRILEVEVEENPTIEITVAPGYGSYEKLRTKLGIRENNLFGTGRALRGEFKLSMKSESVLVGFTSPWLFGSDLSLDVPVFTRRREEPAFVHRESGFGLLLKRQWSQPLSTTFGYSLSHSEISELEGAVGARVVAEDVRLASLFLEPRHDTRNDLFNPSAGHLGSIRLEYGDDFLGSQLNFQRTQLSYSSYSSFSEDWILAFSARTGFIRPLGDTEAIPLQERFFNGGEDSVRSFEESRLGPRDRRGRPLGGEVRNILNLELRHRLFGNVYGALFFDYGNVGRDFEDYWDGFRSGVGTGLRYLLPVGAVRLDAGYKPDRLPGESTFEVHLSVGMAF